MDHDDEYRRQAAEAQAWADRSTTSEMDKAAWLRVAQDWLSLIRGPKRTKQDKFDAAAKAQVTGQDDSESSH
jgi:hypothetical protein